MRFRHLLTTTAIAVTAVAVVPTAAQACGSQPLSQPLLGLGDSGWYTPAENAGFERGTNDWKVRGGAVVTGNEPWKVVRSTDRSALRLQPGGTALSDEVCVTLAHTHARFFARPNSANATLRVDLIWDNDGRDYTATALTLSGAQVGTWAATPIVPVAEWVQSLYQDERDELIALRFTAVSGVWDVDDVLVDPYRSR